MNWFVDTKTELGITTASVHGVLDANDFFRLREAIRQDLDSQGGHSLLLDLQDAVLQMTTLDVFAIASSNPDVFPAGMTFGLLLGPTTLPLADARFLENVMVNRGAHAKCFTDEAVAWEWMFACVDPRDS